MSRRRRRSSRGRKSSSSSKQSVSPFIFQKTSKSNSVCCKDDLIEKGETDSLRKENILLVSDEEDKYNDIPSTEKKFRQDKEGDCFLNKKFTKSEDKNQRTKIVTSVTFDNSVQLPSNITFEQSRGSASEGTTDCTMAITTTKLKCTGPNVKFEIQEVLQPNNSGVKTTFVLQCQQEEDTETCLQNQCVSRPTLNDELLEQSQIADLTLEKDTHTTFNYKFTLGKNGKEEHEPLRNTIPSRSCSRSACRKSCCDNDTDFTFVDGSSCPFWPHWKKNTMRNSFSSDVLWDIPPPLEFADSKYDTVGDLTEEMASFQIGASSSSGQRCFSPTLSNKYNQDSFCLDDKESANYLHFFDQISESDNYEPMFMRPSSVSRSSFTKDFIHSHEGKTWMRNNSIAIVERKPCSSASYQKPTKRRRTFPGVSDGLGPMQEDLPSYRESFSSDTISSFVTHSIPCETERLGQFYKEDYRLSPFGIERRPSSLSSCSYRLGSSNANIHQQRQEPSDLFCFTKQEPNEVVLRDGKFPEHKHLPTGNQRQSDVDLSSNWYESMANQVHNNAGDQVEQNEVAESGYDEEMQEVEEQTQEPLAEECGQVDGDLLIQVIPPSRTTSEEHILEGSPTRSPSIALEGDAKVILTQETSDLLPKRRRGSVMTIIIGGSDHWSLPTESKLTEGSSHEKHHKETYNTVSEVPSVSPILDLEEVESPSTSEIIEEVRATHSRSPSPGNSISSPVFIHTEETKQQSPRTAQGLTDQETENLKKTTTHQAVKKLNKSSVEVKEHLKPPLDPVHKDPDSGPDHWAKRRKLFKESRQWSSAGGSSVTSDITEESVSEENHSMDMNVRDVEDKGFYTETYHSASWIYIGDEPIPNTPTTPSLPTRPRPVTIRERTVRIAKGMGEYPWGFRIQFSKPIVVTEVDTNGAAEEAGLQVGDYVMAVNGTDVTSVPHSEAADLARHGPDLLTLTIGSDIGRSPNTPRPACRGYLHKRTQSGLIKGWRKRWFVLRHDCCLYYYRHKKDEGRRRALSAIKLEGAEVAADTSLGKPFVFKCCPLSANRVYFFCATSSQEIKRWLEAMGRAVHPVTQHHVWVDVTRHNASLPPLAVKNPECLGLLHQIDRNKDVCVQHYCILKDGCLYFYHGIRSTHALGGIYLHGYTVREQPMGSKKSTIELKPPSEEFKTFYLCAEDPTENKRWVVAIKASIKKWLPLHQAIQDYINRPPEETRM